MKAIYQRARPITWDEVVGQEHVKDVLRPALERGRVGHAYLFSGPRGVGKTTTARLIAMTANCEAPGSKPCGQCESCRAVIQGRHPDVLEIDAASNNSVDDVRDLREKVALQPMLGERKIYILDEAHMMSKSAFNALLKTLEEPPAHAVFVLATTEPERLPPTILSRCQHYRFRRLSVAEISGKLARLCQSENVNAQPEALALLARASDGAMRDGESLLERMLASGEPVLTASMVEGALGLPPQERIVVLATALARGETQVLLERLGALYQDGFAPRTITERVKVALRDLLHALLGVGGLNNTGEAFEAKLLLRLVKALDEQDARFARAADLLALEMAFTHALLAGQGDGGGADAGVLARLAQLEANLGGQHQTGASRGRASEFDPNARVARAPRATGDALAASPGLAAGSAASAPNGKTWGDVIAKAGVQLKAFLREANAEISDDVVVIGYGPKHTFHASAVERQLGDVAKLVKEVLGDGVTLELILPDGSKKNASGFGRVVNVAPNVAALTKAVVQAAVVPQALEQTAEKVLSPEPATAQQPKIREAEIQEAPTQEVQQAKPQAAESETFLEPDLEEEALDAPVQTVLPEDQASLLDATSLLEPETNSEPVLFAPLEPPFEAPPEQQPVPPLEVLAQDALEVSVMDVNQDSVPLEAFDLDSLGLDGPVGAASAQTQLQHPMLGRLRQLFSHRVVARGVLENVAARPKPAADSKPEASNDETGAAG